MLQSWTLFHFQRSKTSLILSFPFYFRRKRGFDYSILKNRVVPQFLSPFNKKKKKKKLFPRQRLNFLFCYERIKLKLALSFSSFFYFRRALPEVVLWASFSSLTLFPSRFFFFFYIYCKSSKFRFIILFTGFKFEIQFFCWGRL